jgi:hypothetical protein
VKHSKQRAAPERMGWKTEGAGMTDSVWRQFFDSYAPQFMSEVFTADGVREVEEVWGGTAGSWGRRPVDLDEREIMFVMRRPAT